MNGLQALESLIELPFIDDPRTRHVLESAANDMYPHLLSQLEEALNREFQQRDALILSTFHQCLNDVRQAEEHHSKNATFEAKEELKNKIIQLGEAIECALELLAAKRKNLGSYIERRADQMTSSSSEAPTTATHTGILTKADHLSKGKLAELAISLMLSCFRTPLSTQHKLTKHGIVGDTIVFQENGHRIWNEVKCIDELSKRDIEQLQNLLQSSEGRICYHFVRLFRHQQSGFDTWRDSIINQLNSLELGETEKVFVAFFYQKSLISLKSAVSQGKTIRLQAASSFDLLNSSEAISLGSQTEFEMMIPSLPEPIREMRIVQSSSLLISLASITGVSVFELYKWLKSIMSPPTWITHKWEQPTSTEEIFSTANRLTECLQRPIVMEVEGWRPYLLWHSLVLVEESEGLLDRVS
eukprot:TRINITY_DN6658_c0_g1_i1.p1 TRINITY_DN6658_c0_g1~~TRINITY_DN6658_c0_g1_i1.p1  ORF type:complete len:414 (+),score=40.98 TRINITY_DN6658_c0_g1_i1:70-1311(+)